MLSNVYQHDRVLTIFKNLCTFVLRHESGPNIRKVKPLTQFHSQEAIPEFSKISKWHKLFLKLFTVKKLSQNSLLHLLHPGK